MATARISELTLKSPPTLTDEVEVSAGVGLSRKEILQDIKDIFQADGAVDTFYLIGDAVTDGSWRMTLAGADLELQTRIAGVWTLKQGWTGT